MTKSQEMPLLSVKCRCSDKNEKWLSLIFSFFGKNRHASSIMIKSPALQKVSMLLSIAFL
nr:MAG TPA: hypothetical protein [Inoviridae sp.]